MKVNEKKILEIVKEKEMHGYEIALRLNENQDTSLEYSIGTLYPILRSLKKRRFLKSYEMRKDGKDRIYYKYTGK